MTKKLSVAGIARNTKAQEKKAAQDNQYSSPTLDSFVNFAQKMGIGADNPTSTSSYGFNPITRNRIMLEWIHRGSWLGGVAVDVVADDMTRMGVTLKGTLKPDQIEQINQAANQLGIWNALKETIQWSRLYGGAIAYMMIDGQKPETPLRLDRIGKGAFRGLMVLDRWMVEPSLNDLVTDYGPHIGTPKFYTVIGASPALPNIKIHHSRVIRLDGIRLPYWQRLTENLWGISVLERLYDRMVAFDSATTGASQLVYKSYLRTISVKGLREVVAAGGPAMEGLAKYVDMMRRFQNIEGVTLLDGEDEMGVQQHQAFSGLSDALTQFGQQLAGALQIPLVRLFGQSPAGFSTGDTDLRMYYDSIKQQQEKDLGVGVLQVYTALLHSEGIAPPNGFAVEFKSLWQLTDTDKANITNTITSAVVQAHEAGLISDQTALKELRQSSNVTGVFTNISDEDINYADDKPEEPLPELAGITGGEGKGMPQGELHDPKQETQP